MSFVKKTERISKGIACCRRNSTTNKWEILMIRKRHSYSYQTFIYGRYNSKNTAELIRLFSGMTIDEKLDILSMNFDQMWYRVWLGYTDRRSLHNVYMISKSKFESNFRDQERLKSLIAKSTSTTLVWEIPKGRKKHRNEPDILCAVREFGEETGISKYRYRIIPKKVTYQHHDDGVNYINEYYPAVCTDDIDLSLSIQKLDQLHEISDIAWMSIEEVRLTCKLPKFDDTVRTIFNLCSK